MSARHDAIFLSWCRHFFCAQQKVCQTRMISLQIRKMMKNFDRVKSLK